MPANKIDAILSAPPADRGVRISRATEDQWFERKGSRVSAQTLGQALVSFANAEGGTIVVGVHNGEVEGMNAQGTKRINELRQASIDHTSPPVRFNCSEIECVNSQGIRDVLLASIH